MKIRGNITVFTQHKPKGVAVESNDPDTGRSEEDKPIGGSGTDRPKRKRRTSKS